MSLRALLLLLGLLVSHLPDASTARRDIRRITSSDLPSVAASKSSNCSGDGACSTTHSAEDKGQAASEPSAPTTQLPGNHRHATGRVPHLLHPPSAATPQYGQKNYSHNYAYFLSNFNNSLTTPRIGLFDDRYASIAETIRQNLEELDEHGFLSSSSTRHVGFSKAPPFEEPHKDIPVSTNDISPRNLSQVALEFKNNVVIHYNKTADPPNSMHKDVTVENGTHFDYRSSYIETKVDHEEDATSHDDNSNERVNASHTKIKDLPEDESSFKKPMKDFTNKSVIDLGNKYAENDEQIKSPNDQHTSVKLTTTTEKYISKKPKDSFKSGSKLQLHNITNNSSEHTTNPVTSEQVKVLHPAELATDIAPLNKTSHSLNTTDGVKPVSTSSSKTRGKMFYSSRFQTNNSRTENRPDLPTSTVKIYPTFPGSTQHQRQQTTIDSIREEYTNDSMIKINVSTVRPKVVHQETHNISTSTANSKFIISRRKPSGDTSTPSGKSTEAVILKEKKNLNNTEFNETKSQKATTYRGSVKYLGSPSHKAAATDDLPIPPSATAWALASMKEGIRVERRSEAVTLTVPDPVTTTARVRKPLESVSYKTSRKQPQATTVKPLDNQPSPSMMVSASVLVENRVHSVETTLPTTFSNEPEEITSTQAISEVTDTTEVPASTESLSTTDPTRTTSGSEFTDAGSSTFGSSIDTTTKAGNINSSVTDYSDENTTHSYETMSTMKRFTTTTTKQLAEVDFLREQTTIVPSTTESAHVDLTTTLSDNIFDVIDTDDQDEFAIMKTDIETTTFHEPFNNFDEEEPITSTQFPADGNEDQHHPIIVLAKSDLKTIQPETDGDSTSSAAGVPVVVHHAPDTAEITQTSTSTTTPSSVTTPKVREMDAGTVYPFLRIFTSASWTEVCNKADDFQATVANLLSKQNESLISSSQVILSNLQCDQDPQESTGNAAFDLYFTSQTGEPESDLIEKFLDLWDMPTVNLPFQIEKVELVTAPEPGNNAGVIAAIVISCVAAACLIALAALWFILRRRQSKFKYAQRCTPVSLDDYSLDNVSVYESVRVRRKGVLRISKRSYGNPAFDDPSAPSHPINFAGLANFSMDHNSLEEEFEIVPKVSTTTDELPEGADIKNRYSNVIPIPETRVPLEPKEGIPLSDYINANYVKGPKGEPKFYIACQAPLVSTVTDFWRMIWEQQSKVVLMLTNLVENEKERCADYLPPSEVLDCHRLFGDFQVTLKKREEKDKFVVSTLYLKNLESNLWREVTHIWYLGWPPQGVPEEANSLLLFILEARLHMKSNPAPTVVHCSPGTGRTGVILACDICMREFETTRIVDVPRCVAKLRRDRAGAVTTKEQYVLIYKVLNLYATMLTGGALDSM